MGSQLYQALQEKYMLPNTIFLIAFTILGAVLEPHDRGPRTDRDLGPETIWNNQKKAVSIIGTSLRSYRILNRFRKEGITDLGFKSIRPKRIKRRTCSEIEGRTAVMRAASFGPRQVSDTVNKSLRIKDRRERMRDGHKWDEETHQNEV